MIGLTDCIICGRKTLLVSGLSNEPSYVRLFKDTTSFRVVSDLIEHLNELPQRIMNLTEFEDVRLADLDISAYDVPMRPSDDRHALVSAFGNTHNFVNGQRFSGKEIDWFFKGNASSLQTTGDRIKLPVYAYGGGFEIEYVLVLIVSPYGVPKIVGYAIANDFSDTAMRKRFPNLANLSKIFPTIISHKMILNGDIPEETHVSCIINHSDRSLSWQADGTLGRRAMRFSTAELYDMLYQNELIRLAPLSVHYLLLGAGISTSKSGYEIQHGSRVNVLCDGILVLDNQYEDEGITSACC